MSSTITATNGTRYSALIASAAVQCSNGRAPNATGQCPATTVVGEGQRSVSLQAPSARTGE
jgi:hypothetical protein